MSWKRLSLALCLCAMTSVAQASVFGLSKLGAGKSCGCGESQPAACGPRFPRLAKVFGQRANNACKPTGCGDAVPNYVCGPEAGCADGVACGDAGCGEGCGTTKTGFISRLFPKRRRQPVFGRYTSCAPEVACGDGIGGCGDSAAAGCAGNACGECGESASGTRKPGFLARLFRRKSRCAPDMLTCADGCTDGVETAAGCGSLTQFDAGCGEGCGACNTPKSRRLFRGLYTGWRRSKRLAGQCGEVGCGDAVEANCGEVGCTGGACDRKSAKVASLIRESMSACYARQRRAAIHRLGDHYHCTCHPEIMHAFIYALNDADERVRRKAADEIGDQLAKHRECCSQEIVSALQAAAHDCDPLVRIQARQSLRHCRSRCGMGCADGCTDGAACSAGDRSTGRRIGCADGSCARSVGCTDNGCTTAMRPFVAPQTIQTAPATKMSPAPVTTTPAQAPKAEPAKNATGGVAAPTPKTPEAKPEKKKVEEAEEAPAPPVVRKSVPAKSVSLTRTVSRRTAGRSTRRR